MQLMLAPNWPSSFRRTVLDDGNLAVIYTFEPTAPIEVPEDHLMALRDDIGRALVVPKEGTTKVDRQATVEAVELIEALNPQPKRRRRSE